MTKSVLTPEGVLSPEHMQEIMECWGPTTIAVFAALPDSPTDDDLERACQIIAASPEGKRVMNLYPVLTPRVRER